MIAHQLRALALFKNQQHSVPSKHIVAQNYLLLESLGMLLLASLGTKHIHDAFILRQTLKKRIMEMAQWRRYLSRVRSRVQILRTHVKANTGAHVCKPRNYLEMGSGDKKILGTHRPASSESKTGYNKQKTPT